MLTRDFGLVGNTLISETRSMEHRVRLGAGFGYLERLYGSVGGLSEDSYSGAALLLYCYELCCVGTTRLLFNTRFFDHIFSDIALT